jgi:hypothetical protein
VKTGDHVFGECYRHDYSLLLLPVRDRIGALLEATVRDRIAALLEGVNTGTASFLYCIERDDYTDKCYVD